MTDARAIESLTRTLRHFGCHAKDFRRAAHSDSTSSLKRPLFYSFREMTVYFAKAVDLLNEIQKAESLGEGKIQPPHRVARWLTMAVDSTESIQRLVNMSQSTVIDIATFYSP